MFGKPQAYVVIWDDAHGDTVMFDEKDVEHKPYKFLSLGLLVKSDEVGISLAREKGEDGRYRDHEFIPRAMIIDEWPMGEVKKPRKKRHNGKSTGAGEQSLLADSGVVGEER